MKIIQHLYFLFFGTAAYTPHDHAASHFGNTVSLGYPKFVGASFLNSESL